MFKSVKLLPWLILPFFFMRCPQRHPTYAILNKTDAPATIRFEFLNSEDAKTVSDFYSKDNRGNAPRMLTFSEYKSNAPVRDKDGLISGPPGVFVKVRIVGDVLELEIAPRSVLILGYGFFAARKDFRPSISYEDLKFFSIRTSEARLELNGRYFSKAFILVQEDKYELRFPY